MTSKQMSLGLRPCDRSNRPQTRGIRRPPSVWPGDVDRDAAAGGQFQPAASERRQHRLHHPAIDERHQAIAFGGADEFGGRRGGLRRSRPPCARTPRAPGRVTPPSLRMHDGLEIQLEFVVAQRALQLLQPVDLAAVARVRLLARRIHVHVHAALLLGDVAGGIGRIHEVLDGTAAAADFHQPDADADVEDLVLPHEAVIVDGPHHVVGDLARLLERTPTSSNANSSPPMRPAVSESRTASLMMRRHLAQHIVAGGVPAGVVDHLESVEIEVAQGVRRVARLCGIHAPRAAAVRIRAD